MFNLRATTTFALLWWCCFYSTTLRIPNGVHANETTTSQQQLSQSIVLQLKHVSKQQSKLLLNENVADQDPTHAKFFLKSSTEWFLSSMLSKLNSDNNNDDDDQQEQQQHSMRLEQLQIYKVTIHSQMIGKANNSNNQVQIEPRSGNNGGRRRRRRHLEENNRFLRQQDASALYYDNKENFSSQHDIKSNRKLQSNNSGSYTTSSEEDDDVLVPLYVNMTVYGSIQQQPNDADELVPLTQHEYEELLLFLFNYKSRDLVEKLLDLSAVNVPLFQHVTQIRAVSGSTSSSTTTSTMSTSSTTKRNASSSKGVLSKRIVMIVVACVTATLGILLSLLIYRKVSRRHGSSTKKGKKPGRFARKRYSKVNTEPTQPPGLAPPPPPYYSNKEHSEFGAYPPPQPYSDSFSFAPGMNQAPSGSFPPPPPPRPYNDTEPKPQMQLPVPSNTDNNVNSSRLPSDIPRDIVGGPVTQSESKGETAKEESKTSSSKDKSSSKKKSSSSSSKKSTTKSVTSSSSSSPYATLKAKDYDTSSRICFAPPGTLGIALQDSYASPDEHIGAVVHKLRNGSPLEGILKSGDRIVAVDGTDVTNLKASAITQLMADRSQSRRKLTYVTLKGGINKGSFV